MKTISNRLGLAILIGLSLSGCIDDFSHPGEGYGDGNGDGDGDGNGNGNGASCTSLCESTKGCEGADRDTDCSTACGKLAVLSEHAGCTHTYAAAMKCLGDRPNVCAENVCQAESENFNACLTVYCTDHAQECLDAVS